MVKKELTKNLPTLSLNKMMASDLEEELREKYKKLLKTTIGLSLTTFLLMSLFIIGLYQGWFGEKLSLSPTEAYIKCNENNEKEICGTWGTCTKVTIMTIEESIKDQVCITKN